MVSDHKFKIGEIITGDKTGSQYIIKSIDYNNTENDDNNDIEVEADQILDFNETSPFGTY